MKRYYLFPVIIALIILTAGIIFSQTELFWESTGDESYEFIESLPEYGSSINWTKGKIRTEASLSIIDDSINIGKKMNEYNFQIKLELRQNLIKAMGYIRVSDIFLLKDYYSMKNEIRYEIISYAEKAFYYPATSSKNKIVGIVELNLFGKDGLANIFYRDIDKTPPNHYIKESAKEGEYFDGLVIDSIFYDNFNPSLQMRIYDQDGVLLYGPETVERSILEEKGICEYTTSLLYAFNSERSGTKIFYIVPYSLKGKMNTEIVLHNRDAARLFANPKSAKYVNQARVVVVLPPRKKD